MQITLNHAEVGDILAAYIVTAMPSVEPEEVIAVIINEDGSATIGIGEGVGSDNDTPPVVEKQKRTRGPNKRNPQEAKHRPVNQEPEAGEQTPTTVGGQNESSTLEPEAQGEQVVTPEEQLKEEATEQAEEAASEEASQEAEVQQEVQEEKVAEAPATAKPSLFAGLKR